MKLFINLLGKMDKAILFLIEVLLGKGNTVDD